MVKIKNSKIVIFLILLNITLSFNIYSWYRLSYLKAKESIDLRLKVAAESIRDMLPQNFHNKNLNRNSYSFDELYKIFSSMNVEAKKSGVDYLYTFIKKDEEIYFTSLSGNNEEIKENDKAYFFFPLKNVKDSSYEEIKSLFDKPRIIYTNKIDMWDSYRSVYIPKTASDGTKFIAVADISIKNLKKELKSLYYFLFASIGFFLSLFAPLILSFKTLKKDREKVEKNLQDLSEHDELTGVYKREVGFKFIERHIFLYQKYGIEFSVLAVDISGMKDINSKEGLKNGDILIKILANILASIDKENSKVFRLNDDDFILLSPECDEIKKEFCINKIMEKVKVFNLNNNKNLKLKLHIAYLKYGNEGFDSFIDLINERLNSAKKTGDFHEINLQEKIKIALMNGEFFVCYQPKVNIKTNEITFEALIRWKTKEGDFVSPEDFIPIAEKNYLIFLLTQFVINEVMEIIKNNRIKISINLSPIIIEKNSFFVQILEVIKNFELKEYIIFEITEGVAIKDLKNTIEKIKRFNEIGVHFSMDDFGTGYSSLSNLNLLPMSEVKVDKSFIKEIEERPENRLIIEMIVRLGNILGFQIVAEGVENIEHLRILKGLGCYIFQGYYFDKPIPIDEVLKKLEDDSYIKKLEEK